ncbi:MAG: c-type cytochrome biogenesis protein CcmI [Betaproteobacteria bacterium 13_1_20CM_3_63_8]|nr:MAG: c-type cytochrome biogenesis protein CcmI [Betaproteobacteria bacterium 13_1_20CM_3_63_8]
MLLFWSIATLLVALTLGILLWPLLRGHHVAIAPDDDTAAIAVYRDQKRALDVECAAGTITPSERDATLAELARRVSEDVAATVQAPSPSPAAAESAAAPAPKRAWMLALALMLLVPAAAFTLYQRLGNPVAAVAATAADGGPGHEMSERQIAAMVESLAQRLKQRPGDADGWVLLAHSYQALERFADAADAYAHADALIPNNASLLADYADTLAMAQDRRLEGAPAALIQRALAIDPKHKKALALAATAALETRDLDTSIAYWRRLAAELPAGSDEARQVADVIAEVDAAKRDGKGSSVVPSKRAAANAPPASAPSTARGGTGTAGSAIAGRVDLNAALASKVALNDTVFIFARAAQGPRMPLAVLRIPAKELPRDFSLDDSMSMAPGVKLSAAPSVIVEARISKSGNALPQPGDLFGRSAPLKPGATGVRITIDQVVP